MNARKWLVAVVAVVSLGVSGVGATVMPPFGDSVSWQRGQEDLRLDSLRGKSVLIIFFQSWCGICNRWSGEALKQIEQAYADDPRVVLVAIKTDGGSLRGAQEYLSPRVDPEKWIIGADDNAVYYRQATGKNSLYQYVWVKPDGSVGEVNAVGRTVRDSDPEIYFLTIDQEKAKLHDGASALVPWEGDVPQPLRRPLWLMENGYPAKAVAELAPLDRNADLKEDVAELRTRIAALQEERIARLSHGIAEEGNPRRYLDYLALREMEKDFAGTTLANRAREAAGGQAAAAWIRDEESANREYDGIVRRLARAGDARARERVRKAFENLAQDYPETTYGKLAAAASGGASESES